MSQMTIEDLARVLSLSGRRVRGNAVGSEKLIAEFVDLGVLVPAGTIERVFCDRCDEQHFADIESEADNQGWYCPADGFVKAEPAALAAYTVRVDAFVDHLAGAMDRRRRWAKPRGAPILWSIGSMTVSDQLIAMYFASNAGTPRIFNEILPILSGEPRVDCIAVLTEDTRDLSGLILPRVGKLLSIVDGITIGEKCKINLNREWIGRHVVPEHLLRLPKAGRRNTAEQLAARLILELDGDGKLQAMGQNERHRTLQATAKREFGPAKSLSKEPCNKAWNAYLASNVGRHGVR